MKYMSLIAALTITPAAAVAEAHLETMLMTAQVAGTDGTAMGSAMVTPTESGVALLSLDLVGLPAGSHAIHVHETGDCSAADFTSAGGHLADGHEHGVRAANGPHPGDFPNIMVGEDGTATFEFFNPMLTPEMMNDDDGSAFIVHAGTDDYISQPAGAAGDRIACGVFGE